tara:strand:- start:275 stop:541 length:267 start_codon:yes stop_codon:yes gene_type:complete
MASIKDYEMIATTINKQMQWSIEDDNHFQLLHNVVNDLCEIYAEDNPRFSQDKFLNAVYKNSRWTIVNNYLGEPRRGYRRIKKDKEIA